MKMRQILTTLILTIVSAGSAVAEQTYTLDSNTAFFEGVALAYVFSPPPNMRLITDEAKADGYSFAFIAESDEYHEAGATVGVTIYSLGENSFQSIIETDTSAIREHYGGSLTITPVDSLSIFDGRTIPSFYIDDKSRFIPNIMVSYFDGGAEIVLFELTITANGLPRFLAEQLYIACIQRFKAMPLGELETGRR